jgi:hypothetical protein
MDYVLGHRPVLGLGVVMEETRNAHNIGGRMLIAAFT